MTGTKTINNSQILVPTNNAALVAGGTVKPTYRLALDRGALIKDTFRHRSHPHGTCP